LPRRGLLCPGFWPVYFNFLGGGPSCLAFFFLQERSTFFSLHFCLLRPESAFFCDFLCLACFRLLGGFWCPSEEASVVLLLSFFPFWRSWPFPRTPNYPLRSFFSPGSLSPPLEGHVLFFSLIMIRAASPSPLHHFSVYPFDFESLCLSLF